MPTVRTHTCENAVHERSVTCFHVEGMLTQVVLSVVDFDNHLGPPRKLNVCFCQCEPDVITLVRLRYWPGTPSRPGIAFSFSLLDWLQALLLECQVPVYDFANALKSLITIKYDKVGTPF